MSELKPCPFCGGEAAFERLGCRKASTVVACGDCGAALENGETFKHGRAWNTRAPDPRDARIAELEVEVRQLRGLAG